MHGRGAIRQPATSLRRKLALPPLAALQAEALSSSPLMPAARMLTGSRYHRQWPVSVRAQGVCHVQETPTISQASPDLWLRPLLPRPDKEDRDVPQGAGPSPLPPPLGTEPSHEPVAATVSWGRAALMAAESCSVSRV